MEIYRDAAHQPDHMSAEARVFRPVDADQTREIPTRSDAGYNMIDDDEVIVLDSGARILCRDLADGQVVRTWTSRPGCYLYRKSDRPNGDLLFQLYLLSRDSVCGSDISFDGDYRLFFLDAPMGTGKTHSVREYLRANPWLSVLSITFRQSLARYLSSELGLACYLDNGFWAPAARAQRSRCVVCLDSICKLQSEAEAYDLIITDECVFVKYHFLAGTITNFLPDAPHDAGRVICMQHRIPETTITFYMRCMDLLKFTSRLSAGTTCRSTSFVGSRQEVRMPSVRASGG
ncbi:hypothetical protein V1522DRAFT_438235 [Lipomyces starkeyi]